MEQIMMLRTITVKRLSYDKDNNVKNNNCYKIFLCTDNDVKNSDC